MMEWGVLLHKRAKNYDLLVNCVYCVRLRPAASKRLHVRMLFPGRGMLDIIFVSQENVKQMAVKMQSRILKIGS